MRLGGCECPRSEEARVRLNNGPRGPIPATPEKRHSVVSVATDSYRGFARTSPDFTGAGHSPNRACLQPDVRLWAMRRYSARCRVGKSRRVMSHLLLTTLESAVSQLTGVYAILLRRQQDYRHDAKKNLRVLGFWAIGASVRHKKGRTISADKRHDQGRRPGSKQTRFCFHRAHFCL